MHTLYWVWFTLVFGIATRRAAELSGHVLPEEIYGLSRAQLFAKNLFTNAEVEKILATDISQAQKIVEESQKQGAYILTPSDDEYPVRLANIYAMPLVLYVKGSLAGIDESLAIALVGSRKITPYGKAVAAALTEQLAKAGTVIVSGMAMGIDQTCHKAALAAGAKTIAVLGCGFNAEYPKNSAALKELTAKYGALVTEYPPDYPPVAHNFPVRNRIISGLCNGVLVLEGDEHSGSLITAGHALAQGRDVFAVPGRIDDMNSRGTNKLIKQGAKLVMNAADILEEYIYTYPHLENVILGENFITCNKTETETKNIKSTTGVKTKKADEEKTKEPDTIKKAKRKPAPDYFSTEQLAVYGAVGETPQYSQEIADKTGLGISKVLSALTELEIYGFVKSHTGRRFSLQN